MANSVLGLMGTGMGSPASFEKSLGLQGVPNARELGGYLAEDGRKVKSGILLRTGDLSKATKEDIDRLREVYGLYEVVDLRMEFERVSLPEPEMEGVKVQPLDILESTYGAGRDGKGGAEEFMAMIEEGIDKGLITHSMYIGFIHTPSGKAGYRRFFEELLSLPEGRSLLFHCTQGKDRTGCAAMLILGALGVDEKTILEDYCLTNLYQEKAIEREREGLKARGLSGEKLDLLLMCMDWVDIRTMETVLAWIKNTYGSIWGYLKQELSLTEEDRERLKDKFLE